MDNQKRSTSNRKAEDALEALGRKVKAAQDARAPQDDENRTGWAIGIRDASEFSAAVIVGGMLGFGFDHFAKTVPWGTMAGLALGFMAGTRNIVRLAKNMSVEPDLAGQDVPDNDPLWDEEDK